MNRGSLLFHAVAPDEVLDLRVEFLVRLAVHLEGRLLGVDLQLALLVGRVGRVRKGAFAPLAQLRGRYRYRLLINAKRTAALQDAIRDWLGPLELPRGVRVGIDIDPYSFV